MLLVHQKWAVSVQVAVVQLTYASVVPVNVVYSQLNVESQMDATGLATEIVNVAKRIRKGFYNFILV